MGCSKHNCADKCGDPCSDCCCDDNLAHWSWHGIYIVIWVVGFSVFLGLGVNAAVTLEKQTKGSTIGLVKSAVQSWKSDAVNGFNRFDGQQFAAYLDFTCGTNITVNLTVEASPPDAFRPSERSVMSYPVRRHSASIPIESTQIIPGCHSIVRIIDVTTGQVISSTDIPFTRTISFGENTIGGFGCPARVATAEINGQRFCVDKAGARTNGKMVGEDRTFSVCRNSCDDIGGIFTCDGYTGIHTCTVNTYSKGVCIKVASNRTDAPFSADNAYPYAGMGCSEVDDEFLGVNSISLTPSMDLWTKTRPGGTYTTFTVTVRSSHDPYLMYLKASDYKKDFGPDVTVVRQQAITFLVLACLFFMAGIGLELGYCFAKCGVKNASQYNQGPVYKKAGGQPPPGAFAQI